MLVRIIPKVGINEMQMGHSDVIFLVMLRREQSCACWGHVLPLSSIPVEMRHSSLKMSSSSRCSGNTEVLLPFSMCPSSR